jgi:curli production assembly/transport component CsgF
MESESKTLAFGALLFTILVFGSTAVSPQVDASELVYQPVNPNFGGNPFNGQYLLNSATLQNQYLDDSGPTRRDPLAEFTTTLQRRLLSELAGQITDAIFGEDAAESGTITVGDTTVDFERIGDQVRLQITDAATGNETVIELPVPSF